MLLADSAFAAGQLFGIAVLLILAVGLVRTFTRSDLTVRDKVLGKSKPADPR